MIAVNSRNDQQNMIYKYVKINETIERLLKGVIFPQLTIFITNYQVFAHDIKNYNK